MYDKLIFELSVPGRIGYNLPNMDVPSYELPKEFKRSDEPLLPEVSEIDVVRHYTNLSRKTTGRTKACIRLVPAR